MKSILCTFLFSFFFQAAYAQCPPATVGHHRVQKGETLYKISKNYRVSVDQICVWNGIQKSSILDVCQELWITSPSSSGTPQTQPTNNLQPQQGTTHRIKPGETIAGLAELYGYTESRFREINGLSPSEPSWEGLVLKTSDCICTNPLSEFDPVLTDAGNSESGQSTGTGEGTTYPGQPSFPTWEEAIAINDDDPAYSDSNNPFNEDPYYETSPSIAVYNKEDKRVNAPTSYSKEVEKITAPNSPKPSTSPIPTNPPLDPKVRRSEGGGDAPDKTFVSPEEELIRKQRKDAPTTSNKPSSEKPSTSTTERPAVTKAAASYMSAEEIEMVNEINLVRSNPPAYVKYIEEYKKDRFVSKDVAKLLVADELIAELKRTPPLGILEPTECIYNAAKKHGEDQRPTGDTDHVGRDGSYPWDRVRRECPYMTDGRENLVSGPETVRECVIILLIDKGISNRGHRRTLLDKTWKYAACYNIGPLGAYQSSWVQKFGK